MKILVVTNRNLVNPNAGDERVFGETPNQRGGGELRLAFAEKVDDGWQVALIKEPKALTGDNLPSLKVFPKFLEGVVAAKRDAVLYNHGFNKSFKQSLEQAWEIQVRYQVAVILFSWPSNPGGFITHEYRRAQAIARNSVVALDRLLGRLRDLLASYRDEACGCSINFLCHSLGNYLFMSFVQDPIFTDKTRIFDNIILNAPDVDSNGHHAWLNKLGYSRRVYVMVNERDRILDAADVIGPDRLGNTARNFKGDRAIYVDLSDGKGVGKRHRHFEAVAEKNQHVEALFQAAFQGQQALPQKTFSFNSGKNAWELA